MHILPKDIELDKYYIVDITELNKPELFRNDFKSLDEGVSVIRKYLKFDFKHYQVIKGEEAIKHKIKFKESKFRVNFINVVKYDYPPERVTLQNKKTWRTIQRRKQKQK